ncbi:hypothetical protein BG004_008134 [Podila humilis]|nr:hypothetical protein BG004_008134 [Podila humilis]
MHTLLCKDITLAGETISTHTTEPIAPFMCSKYSEKQSPLPKAKTLSLQDYLCLSTRPRFLKDMRASLIELGTFYIKDHDVSPGLIHDTMTAVREYFDLPLEEKKKMLIGNSRHFRGYKVIGEEFTNNQADHREQLQFGPEDEADASFLPGISPDYIALQGPNQWPVTTLDLLPRFRPCILEYMDQLEILSIHLMEAIALSLDLNASYFRDLFGANPFYRLKAARYPSVPQGSSVTIGCGAHKDTGFLTVLLQDSVGGLQGQDPASDAWLDTRPIQGTFIVTLGQAIEKLTDGIYHATVHRVLNNNSGMDRYSIPFFFDPSLNVQVPSTLQASKHGLAHEAGKNEQSEGLIEGLKLHDGLVTRSKREEASVTSPWSNGAHIFETVHRCHPEVYTRWYRRDV